MNVIKPIKLQDKELREFYSDYLINGRKHDGWTIEIVQIENACLRSRIRMNSVYLSSTDKNQFHLTIFSALEFLSQLMIIYTHVWAGLTKKTQEGWMVDSQIRAVKAIRNPNAIEVEMQMGRIRKLGTKLVCMTEYVITDDGGGRFEGSFRGFLS